MSQSQVDDPHVLRVMVSTDNHLGVWERDEWRAEDSFVSFGEVFDHAKQQRSDLVLLGGDLFHDNKPSRQTLFKCFQIMNQHCLGSEPISFQVASSPELMESGVANTHDPNLNVGLPVFTIHGNHDDPSGPENLSAVDLLSAVHYVNYFGKHTMTREGTDDVGKIVLSPVLLMKGDTKVALYGLGFMREERLARAFQVPGQVEWLRPAESAADWFNVFVLHQNRVQHYKTNPGHKARSVRAEFLPDWLDVVVWGHEHESRPAADDAPLSSQGFVIAQPGSSVATSLSEQEAKPKHCFSLEICRDAFRLTPLALGTVRPFKFKTVSLQELGAEPGNHSQMEQLLADVVEGMIGEAEREHLAAPTDASAEPLGPTAGDGGRPARLPLVRLRVDYTGFTTIHTLRFGQRFVNRVANPNDILLWHKTTERKAREVKKDARMQGMPADLDEVQIEDLIAEFTGHLAIAPVVEIGEALKRFVEKDEKSALSEAYNKILKDTQEAALDDLGKAAAGNEDEPAVGDAADAEDAAERQVIDAVHAAGRRLQAEAIAKFAEADVRLRLAEQDAQREDPEGGGDENVAQADESEEEEEEPAARPSSAQGRRAPATKKAASRSAAAKSRTSRAQTTAKAGRGGAKAAGKGAGRGTSQAGPTLAHLFSQSQANAASKGRKNQAGQGTQVHDRLAAAGLGPTQADEDMDDPIEDSPQEAGDDEPPAKSTGAVRGRVRARAAAEQVSSSDESLGGNAKHRTTGKRGRRGGSAASRRR